MVVVICDLPHEQKRDMDNSKWLMNKKWKSDLIPMQNLRLSIIQRDMSLDYWFDSLVLNTSWWYVSIYQVIDSTQTYHLIFTKNTNTLALGFSRLDFWKHDAEFRVKPHLGPAQYLSCLCIGWMWVINEHQDLVMLINEYVRVIEG